jgi:hypothetical protein
MSAGSARPGRIPWAALIGLLWAISFGALRDYVWADLREGLVRLHGLTRAVRFQVVLGFLLLLAAVGLLLFNDVLRLRFDLSPASLDIPGRGNLIPSVLLPVTLLLMALAWSYALAGALRIHPAMGSIPLLLYLSTAAGALVSAGDPSAPFVWAGWAALGLVVVMFVTPPLRRLPADIALVILLALVGVQYGLVQTEILLQDRISGIKLGQINLESSIQSMQSLALPFLLLVGMDIARFTQQASTWVVLVVRRRLPVALVYGALIGLWGWLAYEQATTLRTAIADNGARATLFAYLGGLGTLAGVTLVWLVVEGLARRGRNRVRPGELGEQAEKVVLWVVLARMLTVLIAFGLFQLQGTVGTAAYLAAGPTQNVLLITMALIGLVANWAAAVYDVWLWITAAGALVIGIILAWRRPDWEAAGLYVAAYGATELWLRLTDTGAPLAWLAWSNQTQVQGWLLLPVALAALAWIARRALTPARAGGLLFLLMVLALLKQTAFIENPFSPFFGFAGVGFIAFGIVWDALTAGSWANVETRALPRTGRIFLYIGYVLLTVALINWMLATHDLDATGRFTGDAALMGLTALGKPLLYLLFPVVLARHVEEEMGAAGG